MLSMECTNCGYNKGGGYCVQICGDPVQAPELSALRLDLNVWKDAALVAVEQLVITRNTLMRLTALATAALASRKGGYSMDEAALDEFLRLVKEKLNKVSP